MNSNYKETDVIVYGPDITLRIMHLYFQIIKYFSQQDILVQAGIIHMYFQEFHND